MPMSRGMNHPVAFSMRTSSTKILEKAGITIPGTTSVRLTDQQADRRFRAAQLAEQNAQWLRLPADLPELGVGLEGQNDPGECPVQFRHVDSTPSDCGIVDEDGSTVDAFENDEMIEIPVNDARHGQRLQGGGLGAERSRGKSESSCRSQDVGRLAAVP